MNFIKYKGRYVCCHSISTTYKIYSLTKDFLLGQSQKYEAKIFKNFIAMLTMIFKPRYKYLQRLASNWKHSRAFYLVVSQLETFLFCLCPGLLQHYFKGKDLLEYIR